MQMFSGWNPWGGHASHLNTMELGGSRGARLATDSKQVWGNAKLGGYSSITGTPRRRGRLRAGKSQHQLQYRMLQLVKHPLGVFDNAIQSTCFAFNAVLTCGRGPRHLSLELVRGSLRLMALSSRASTQSTSRSGIRIVLASSLNQSFQLERLIRQHDLMISYVS